MLLEKPHPVIILKKNITYKTVERIVSRKEHGQVNFTIL